MKFISKSNNLRVVLKHGVPAEPITGRDAVAGVYIKFENGLVNIDDDDIIKMMISHPGFNIDFIAAEEDGKDPYSEQRIESEPQHDLTEIKYGHVGESKKGKRKVLLTKEQKEALSGYVMEEAKKIAVKIAPDLAKEIIKSQLKESNESNVNDKVESEDKDVGNTDDKKVEDKEKPNSKK